MNVKIAQSMVFLLVMGKAMSSAILIWELLTYQEKMGRLMYSYVHLVERYCKIYPSTDCRKVMTLHGISNLLNYDEQVLDLLDPDQRDGAQLLWQAATKSQFKYPFEKYYDYDYTSNFGQPDYFDNEDGPPKVVVPAPKFLKQKYRTY